jgi:hypothetical protein
VALSALRLTERSDALYRTLLATPDHGAASPSGDLGRPEEQVRKTVMNWPTLLLRAPLGGVPRELRVVSPQAALDLLLSRRTAEVARR